MNFWKNPEYSSIKASLFLLVTFICILLISQVTGGRLFSLVAKVFHGKEKYVTTADFLYDTSLDDSSPNSFLIKIKAGSINKIKVGKPTDVGIASLNDLNIKNGVSTFDYVAKKTAQSKDKNANIYRWVKITIPDTPEISVEELLAQGETEKARKLTKFNKKLAIMEEYRKNSNVETVEPNYTVQITTEPNDPYYYSAGSWGQSFDDLWGIKKINAETAWNNTTGSNEVIVADIDTGVDRNHPDLASNMWVNEDEIESNGIDDDGNGYIDDSYGWNFVSDNNEPMDDHGHGSHTAGTIAAIGNNEIGVVGVNWNAKIMPLKFLGSNGSGLTDDAIEAVQYAVNKGAKVLSNSWGCECRSQALVDIIEYANQQGVVFVAAAGNSSKNAIDFYPAGAEMAITVGATDNTDTIASFSNTGSKIDVTAPGVDILSVHSSSGTMCNETNTVEQYYCHVSGTSMAAPHVAGLVALLLSYNPTLLPEEIRQILRMSATDLGIEGRDVVYGYGRINATEAITMAHTPVLVPIITSPKTSTTISGNAYEVQGSILGSTFSQYKVEVGLGRAPTSWTLIHSSTTQVNNGVLATIDTGVLADGKYTLKVTATDTEGKNFEFEVYDIDIDNIDLYISSPTYLASKGDIEIRGSARVNSSDATFVNYTLEYGMGNNPSVWSTAGIILSSGGLNPVYKDKLGTWNTGGLLDNTTYTLRAKLITNIGTISEYKETITIDPLMKPGWPVTIMEDTDQFHDVPSMIDPTIEDINNDGTKELIAAATNKIVVLKNNGTYVSGFPIYIDEDENITSIAVEDLDGDGFKELVVGAYMPYDSVGSYTATKIYIFRYDGSPYSSNWPQTSVSHYFIPQSDIFKPSIADINQDGEKEIVYYDPSKSIVALTLEGETISGYPVNRSGCSVRCALRVVPVSLSDVNGDGSIEILINDGYSIDILDNTGTSISGFPTESIHTIGSNVSFASTPTLADVNGDTVYEIYIMAIDGPGVLYGYDLSGILLPGFPKTAADRPSYSSFSPKKYKVSVADIDKDNKDEVFTSGEYLSVFGDVPGIKKMFPIVSNTSQPVLADIVSDNNIDIVSAGLVSLQVLDYNGSVYLDIVNGKGGDLYIPTTYYGVYSNPVVSDMENNGKADLAVMSGFPDYLWAVTGYVTDKANSTLYVWEFNDFVNTHNDWPMFGKTSALLSRLVPDYQNTPIISGDNTPPVVSVTTPTNNSTVSGSITISATAVDLHDVQSVSFFRGSTFLGTDTTAPYNILWNSESVSNGSYLLHAQANDSSGNIGTSSLVMISVFNSLAESTFPSTYITYPADEMTFTKGDTFTTLAYAVDDKAIVKVEFYRDLLNDNFAPFKALTDTSPPYSYTWNTQDYSEGTYQFYTKAYDADGNSTTSPLVTIIISSLPRETIPPPDTSNPVVSIISPLSHATVSDTVTLRASATDNTSVDHVDFYLDDTIIGGSSVITDSTFNMSWDTKATNDGAHILKAKAYDAFGNTAVSEEISIIITNIVVTPDTTAPTISIVSPSNNSTLSGITTLSATASDELGISKVEFYKNGILLDTDTTGSPNYSISWDTASAIDGTHTLTAKAYDTSENINTSNAITVTVSNKITSDTIPPTIIINSPVTGSSISGITTITATAHDNVDIAKVTALVDGVAMGVKKTSPYSIALYTTLLSEGTHTLIMKAQDMAGNISQSPPVIVTVSNTENIPPENKPLSVFITSPASGSTVTGSTTIVASASDNESIAKVEFYRRYDSYPDPSKIIPYIMNTDSSEPYTYTWDTTSFGSGTYTIFAKAYDNEGNETTSPEVILYR